VREAVQRVAGQWPTYGYRRITAQLRREGLVANSKCVRRLMGEMGLSAKPRSRRKRTTNSDHCCFARFPNLVKGLEVTRPDQVWVADITYIALRQEFVYLAVLMDVFTRCIRGWFLSRRLDADLTVTALKRALAQGKPQIHHSDQGVQYAATEYVQVLQAAPVHVSMAAVGCPEENGYAERLMRTIKGRGSRSDRVRRLWGRLLSDRSVPGGRVSDQTHPLGSGLPHPGRVRGPMARAGRAPVRH
jgi:transposase InsO family protein